MEDRRKAREDYLERVLIGGRETRSIVIVDYDGQWPQQYETQRRRILSALGSVARLIEHVGSTSVPGLAAKPIIDIVVTVADVEEEQLYVPPLERVGYELRVREDDHRMLRTPERDVHIHVYTENADHVSRYLLLRDWLRQHNSDRLLYAQAKRDLATRTWRDTNEYAEAKTEVIESILRRAEQRS